MTLDLDSFIVVLVLLGHVGLAVVMTNVTHALGASDRWVTGIRLVLLTAIIGMAALIVRSASPGRRRAGPGCCRLMQSACLATLLIGLPLTSLYRKHRPTARRDLGPRREIDLAGAGGERCVHRRR